MPQDTFLPWKASSSGHLVFRPIFENLTTIDPNTGVSKIYPQLATEWEMSRKTGYQKGSFLRHVLLLG
jgi:ABC-type transport system substrate-binding protein